MIARRGGIARRFMEQIISEQVNPLELAKSKAVKIIPWGHDCKRYEFADGTRLIHNELANGWDV